MKKIAVINDLSGFGKCSLSAALPIISAHGIQCCPLPTGVYSNQTGYESYQYVDLTDALEGFIDEWRKLGASFDGILTGFLPSSRQGQMIARFIDEFKTENTVVVVDPVMADGGELYKGFDDERVLAVKRLAARADILTPNLNELCVLCDADYAHLSMLNEAELFYEVETLSRAIDKTVVTTGIPLMSGGIANAVFDGERFGVIRSEKYGGSFSGTGDILSSFVAAQCVRGENIFSAVEKASRFIEKSVERTVQHPYRAEDGVDFESELT